jgi:para-nitrobenzyl esterase
MMRTFAATCLAILLAPAAHAADRVTTKAGPIEGAAAADGVRAFKGIPFAAPPVGPLRWQAPQPPKPWTEVRPATAFGGQCMQRRQFADMVFRASGTSEDCLYLNVWTPANAIGQRLPVLVYFYGGGFVAGDGSEPRYDGAAMAKRGIVALTVNYRLGVFGMLAHPELTRESPHHASGNYGLLDQHAALEWVRDNIEAFGGDPRRVTIAGESAGSISVSAQMASPLSKDLIAGAIGESGAMISPTTPAVPLDEAERTGTTLATFVGAASLAALRAMPASALLEAAARPQAPRLSMTIDGYFLTKPPVDVFTAGEQARVPLLAGWNSQEGSVRALLGQNESTAEGYAKAVRDVFGDRADEALKLYPGGTTEEIEKSATALAGDRFIGFSTWKWIDAHARTGGKPVYRYFYSRPRPAMKPGKSIAGQSAGPARGAAHSAEIEYALGNLATNEFYAWTADDYKVSETFQGYIANFVKTGDPNGTGLPAWPAAKGDGGQVLHIDVDTRAEPDITRERYLFLDRWYSRK